MKTNLSKVGIVEHRPLNPFKGKIFKILTYNQVDQVVNTETVTIESQEELKTTLDSIKQYNDAHAQLEGFLKLTKKLITDNRVI